MRFELRRLLAAAAALALASPMSRAGSLAAQATGVVTGRVAERASDRPLANAQVRIFGTTRGAVTTDSGTYRIPGVPVGTMQLAVQRLGFGPQSRTVTV